MSKLLRKLLKYSFLPAATMVAAKSIGIYLSAWYIGASIFTETSTSGIFTVRFYTESSQSQFLINSISDGIMLGTMLLVNFYILVRYTLYRHSKGNPRTIVKLTKFNLLKWVTDKESVFPKVFTWNVFLFSTCAVVVAKTIQQLNPEWLGLTAFIISIIFMWSLVRTFELETARIYPKDDNNYL